jgi:hypothetical protein
MVTTTGTNPVGSPYTRAGGIDPTATVAANTFLSEVRGSTLLVQIPNNTGVTIYKAVAGALSTKQLWWCAIGSPYQIASASANDPFVALALWKAATGKPDVQNNFVRTTVRTSNDATGMFAVTAGSGTINTSNTTVAGIPYFIDGLGMRIDHGSSGSSNAVGWSWTRRGGTQVIVKGQAPQFNASTDFVGFQLQSTLNSGIGLDGNTNGSIFSLHFIRRTPALNGFIAQS